MQKRAHQEGRADDTEEAFHQRLDVFASQTRPVLHHYQRLGTRIVEIDGVGAIDEVTERIASALQGQESAA